MLSVDTPESNLHSGRSITADSQECFIGMGYNKDWQLSVQWKSVDPMNNVSRILAKDECLTAQLVLQILSQAKKEYCTKDEQHLLQTINDNL